ncbi:MAG: DUF2497 domain-containing protein [Rhodospirillales bacterium]|nr:DUF2497 domain-containing protein [Rhodospirillales bacterium]
MNESSANRKAEAQEPSMDDILASIRRILAEDSTALPEAADPPPPPAAPPAGNGAAGVREAVSAPTTRDAAPTPPAKAPEEKFAQEDIDAMFAAAPDAFAAEPPRFEQSLPEPPLPEPQDEDADLEPPPVFPAAGRPLADAVREDIFMLSPELRTTSGHTLVSKEAAGESTDVLSRLARAILDRRDLVVSTRDVTLESMVREMLRPLLREWLDRNLPYLIERLVKKEIDLMINRAERLED